MQPAFSIAAQDALRRLGHVGLGEAGMQGCQHQIGSVQAVWIAPATGIQSGAADPRREGTVIQLPDNATAMPLKKPLSRSTP